MNVGKELRAKRIFRDDGRTLIVAMDHSRDAAYPGLEDYLGVVKKIHAGGADAILINYGNIVRFCRDLPRDLGIIFSMSPPHDPNQVKMASKVGAHGVKNTFLGPINDWGRLKTLLPIAAECERLGLVFLGEVIPQDEKGKILTADVASAARIGMEAGADIIKTAYTGSVRSFREVIRVCPVPVVAMGGPKMGSDAEALETVKGCIEAGGAGVAFGRNIFQHRNPTAMTRAIAKIVHEDARVEESLRLLK